MPLTSSFSAASASLMLGFLLSGPLLAADPVPPEQPPLPETITKIGPRLVTISAQPGSRFLDVIVDKKQHQIPLPKDGGEVREILAGPWEKNRIVAALECYDPRTKTYHYYWSTNLDAAIYLDAKEKLDPNPEIYWARFYSSPDDLDIASVKNPTDGGDSIYILLAKRTRERGPENQSIIDDLAIISYVNDCPVVPSVPGKLRKHMIDMVPAKNKTR